MKNLEQIWREYKKFVWKYFWETLCKRWRNFKNCFTARCAKNRLVTRHKRVVVSEGWPGYDLAVTRSEIGKFEKGNEKCFIWKCNQRVTHLSLIRDTFETHRRSIHNPSSHSSVTHLRSICHNVWPNSPVTQSIIHMRSFVTHHVTRLICDPSVTYLRPTHKPLTPDSYVTYISVVHPWPPLVTGFTGLHDNAASADVCN